MSESANCLGLPVTGEVPETRNVNQWASPGAGATEDATARDARRVDKRQDDVASSYFHVRWLGEAD